MAKTIQCPECPVKLPEDDIEGQSKHMMENHIEVVEQRRREAARWDGWVTD